MVRSLYLYSRYITSIALSRYRRVLLTDLGRFFRQGSRIMPEQGYSKAEREAALSAAVQWLITASEKMQDDGMGSFHLARGWSSSYPETTGYLVPTLLEYARHTGVSAASEVALKASRWLLLIQKASGGWQGGRVGENRPKIVFNTGQVIRGMLSAYDWTGEPQFLDSAVRAGDWLAEVQHPDGYWKAHALMNEPRVYDAFVDFPLLQLFRHTRYVRYKEAAERNIHWIIEQKQHSNGWFEDCDNTVRHNDRPILHTLAYTIDGLLDCGLYLQDESIVRSALLPAERLRDMFLAHRFLYGRYDGSWNGSEYSILTGCAQMSLLWMKAWEYGNDGSYREAALKMADKLILLQQIGGHGDINTRGGLPGSYPIWGKYEPFAFPNWATKFFADALMRLLARDS